MTFNSSFDCNELFSNYKLISNQKEAFLMTAFLDFFVYIYIHFV